MIFLDLATTFMYENTNYNSKQYTIYDKPEFFLCGNVFCVETGLLFTEESY